MIITVYNEIINSEAVKLQRLVFQKFGQHINQIKPVKWTGHANTIDDFLKNNDWEYIIVFDIDCIPLDEKIIPETIEWVKNNIGLFSVAQNPNHIKNAPDYASPAFIAFSKKTYDMLGQPSFAGTNKWDVGGQFTYEASKLGVEVKMMYPSHVEIPKWLFKDGTRFGIGTTYQNRIYHNFESRKNKMQGFINICKKIIG